MEATHYVANSVIQAIKARHLPVSPTNSTVLQLKAAFPTFHFLEVSAVPKSKTAEPVDNVLLAIDSSRIVVVKQPKLDSRQDEAGIQQKAFDGLAAFTAAEEAKKLADPSHPMHQLARIPLVFVVRKSAFSMQWIDGIVSHPSTA